MAKFKSYEETHGRRSARIDGKRIIIESGEQHASMRLDENGEPRNSTASQSDIVLVCGLCAQEVSLGNVVLLLDQALHRTPCAERIVEEILEEEYHTPGRFDAATIMHARALSEHIRRERWRGRLNSIRSLLRLE